MRIADLLERQRPVFSFEFFPPKTDEGQQTLRNTLEVLKDDEPDYVSVTYGAGGTTRNRTVEITKSIKQRPRHRGDGAPLAASASRASGWSSSSRRSRRPGSRTCSPCAATRRAARPSGGRTPGASPTRSS